MPKARSQATAVVVGETILVMGDSTIDEYSPFTNEWRTLSWQLPPHKAFTGSRAVSYDPITGSLMIIEDGAIYVRKRPFEEEKWVLVGRTGTGAETFCS
jgi:hypothetical protein